jgi:hypothetical protein
VVRWTVAGEPQSVTLGTSGLVDRFRGRLVRATEDGEAFDLESGLPKSMQKAKQATSVLTFALAYMDMKWPGAAAKSCDSMTDASATALPVLVKDSDGRPERDSAPCPSAVRSTVESSAAASTGRHRQSRHLA